MIFFLPLTFIVLVLVYVSLNVYFVLSRNYKCHKFYATKTPQLPVIPNPSIFSGHYFQITQPDKNWQIIERLHKKYGPTFGYYMCDQPWVSTKDLDLLRLIGVEKPTTHINRSKFGLPFEEFNNSIFQVDDDEWRRARRAVSPALSNHKVRTEEVSEDIVYVVDQLKDSLERKLNTAKEKTGARSFVMDVNDTFRRFTLAVIFLVTYKKENIIDFNSETDNWAALMDESGRKITNPIVSLSMMFPFMRPLCKWLIQFHKTGHATMRIIDWITEATDINRMARKLHQKTQRRISSLTGAKELPFSDCKSEGAFKRRLVDTFIDAFMEKKITHKHFLGTSLFLMLAGYETTANTITCLIWHLARQVDLQERLREVIITEGRDAEFVMWCILETVRWHPAVPLGTGRILSEDVTINGYFLPKGCFIMPSTYSIHHDPSIWPDADSFKPERFHDKYEPTAFMGFGKGPRNCVGKNLAIQEMKLVMEMLLTQYRFVKCAETSEAYDFSSPGLVYTILDQPIKVKLVPLDANAGAQTSR